MEEVEPVFKAIELVENVVIWDSDDVSIGLDNMDNPLDSSANYEI